MTNLTGVEIESAKIYLESKIKELRLGEQIDQSPSSNILFKLSAINRFFDKLLGSDQKIPVQLDYLETQLEHLNSGNIIETGHLWDIRDGIHIDAIKDYYEAFQKSSY